MRDVEHLAERRRCDGAARARDLEELRFGELPRLDRVGDEHGLDVRVLPTQPLDDPEECFASRRSRSVMLEETSIAKNTTASVAGRLRSTICR